MGFLEENRRTTEGELKFGTLYKNTSGQFERIYNQLENNKHKKFFIREEYGYRSISAGNGLWKMEQEIEDGSIAIRIHNSEELYFFDIAKMGPTWAMFNIPGNGENKRYDSTEVHHKLDNSKIGSTVLETLEKNPEFFEHNKVMADFKTTILTELREMLELDPKQKRIKRAPKHVIAYKDLDEKLIESEKALMEEREERKVQEAETVELRKKVAELETALEEATRTQDPQLRAENKKLREDNARKEGIIASLKEKVGKFPFFGKRIIKEVFGDGDLLTEGREDSTRDVGAAKSSESSGRDQFMQSLNFDTLKTPKNPTNRGNEETGRQTKTGSEVAD